MMKGKKQLILPAVFVSIFALLAMPATNSQIVFAESTSNIKPKVLASEQLQKNPLAMKIIAEMEAQKLRYKQQMQQKAQQAEIEQKRILAKERLAERLQTFLVKYQDKLPEAAFAKFVEKKPQYIHGVFWGMFDYMQGKVDKARAAMKEVLENGGSLHEARDAYFENASTKRVQLIEVVKNLNIKHGLAEKSVQDTFDEFGKLPRSDA